MQMRYLRVVILAALLSLAAESTWAEDKTNTICQLCGMDAAKSETEFILDLKTRPALHACCANCTRRLKKKLGDEITNIRTLDFRTREYVSAAGAFYVRGSERIPKGSMTPFVFAFGTRTDADAFRNRYGGVVLTFDALLEEMEAAARGR